MAELKDKNIGGFKVLQEIQAGSGSQGTVYKAECVEEIHKVAPIGTVVAMKVMAVQDENREQWRKLEKRTKELAKLVHPNVVRYYGCFAEQGMFNDVHVVVQEFLQGETLKERLQRFPSGLDADEALKIVDAALAGLEYTANCGLVHRDVKPGNIFVCQDDKGSINGVKLIDFEIAKQEGGTVTTAAGNIRGSFDYMAPDFTNAEFHGDVQSDIFSMGVVLHEVLTGKTPYQRLEGDDKQANFAFLSRWANPEDKESSPIHISSRIKRLLSHADKVLERALSPNRAERFKTFAEFRAALKGIRFRDLVNGEHTYRMLQFIGKGGFGEVFKARYRQSGSLVAVKHLLKADYADRFYREAKIMKKLRDPCFVQFVDFFVMEGRGSREAFLVMAFLDGMPGSSLRDAIKAAKGAPLPFADAMRAFERYALGLKVMHNEGIYHRDIKPSNLYYPKGKPHLAAIMDLGIARDVNGTATHGMVPGTLDYMPPEVVLSDNRGDGGMDIYALGLCLYEAITGRMGYPRLPTGTAAYATFFNRAKSKTSPIFDHPLMESMPELRALLVKMTDLDPAKRIKDAAYVAGELHQLRLKYRGIGPVEESNGPETSPTEWIGVDLKAIRHERRMRQLRNLAKRLGIALPIVVLLGVVGYFVYPYARDAIAKLSSPVVTTQGAAMGGVWDERSGSQSAEQQRVIEDIKKKVAEEEKRLQTIREEAERQRKAAEEAKRRAEEEAKRRAEEEAERQRKAAEEEAKRRAEEEAKRAEEEAERQRKAAAEAEERRKVEEEARRKAEEEFQAKLEEMRRKAEEEAELKAKAAAEEARRQAEEDARRKVKEAEDKRKAEEEKRKAEEAERLRNARDAAERKRIEEENAKKEAERQRLAEEERRQAEAKAKEEADRKAKAAAEEARRKAEEARLKAEEEARRKAAEEAEAKRKAEEEARRKAAEEAERQRLAAEEAERQRLAAEEAERQRLAEEERQRQFQAQLEAARREAEEARKALEEARRQAEEAEKLRKAAEEAERQRKEAEAAAERQRAAEEAKAIEEARQAAIAAARAKAAEEAAREEEARIAREREEAEKRRQAEEAERKRQAAAEAERQRKEAEAKKNAANNEARELAARAIERYEFEEYYDTVKFFYEAKKKGYQPTTEDKKMIKNAFSKQKKRLDLLINRSEKMMQQGRALIRPLKEIEDERRALMDWYSELK